MSLGRKDQLEVLITNNQGRVLLAILTGSNKPLERADTDTACVAASRSCCAHTIGKSIARVRLWFRSWWLNSIAFSQFSGTGTLLTETWRRRKQKNKICR
jgi:hypothetical protein